MKLYLRIGGALILLVALYFITLWDPIPADLKLFQTIHAGEVEKARQIIRKHPELANDQDGLFNYLSVSIESCPELIPDLVKAGANPNGTPFNLVSPMVEAIRSEKLSAVKHLVECEADLNQMDDQRRFPISHAYLLMDSADDPETMKSIVKYLKENGGGLKDSEAIQNCPYGTKVHDRPVMSRDDYAKLSNDEKEKRGNVLPVEYGFECGTNPFSSESNWRFNSLQNFWIRRSLDQESFRDKFDTTISNFPLISKSKGVVFSQIMFEDKVVGQQVKMLITNGTLAARDTNEIADYLAQKGYRNTAEYFAETDDSPAYMINKLDSDKRCSIYFIEVTRSETEIELNVFTPQLYKANYSPFL